MSVNRENRKMRESIVRIDQDWRETVQLPALQKLQDYRWTTQ